MSYSRLQQEDVGEMRRAKPVFKRFEIVKDYSDHHYAKPLSSKKMEKFTSSFAARRLQKELNKLEIDLPESMIYVCAYQGRPDLLRAVIVGARGTPYHDNLFFFDLCFCDDYPFTRPKIHYHSSGQKMNPWFRKNGQVTIDTLGLWTVCSLLLSIQALVLTQKSFINGLVSWPWMSRKDREEKAAAYNEEVFLKSCKTMLCLLDKPPRHFEEFVAWHFRRHGETILLACRAYVDGYAKVGCQTSEYGVSACVTTTKYFRSSMDNLYPKLLAGFTKNECALKKVYCE